MSDSNRDAAERLKILGNKLHQNAEYQAAYAKYSEAIQKDPKNAILYANRAASSLAMKNFLDTVSDAEKATDLDPKYAKAWARLGTATHALSSWSRCVDAWETALSCLPTGHDKLSAEDARLKAQFQEGLRKAQASMKAPPPVIVIPASGSKQHPWQRALAVKDKLIADHNVASSGFVIMFAYEEFIKGVTTMKMITSKVTGNGATSWEGKPHAIADISNGILRDSRVFHMDCNDWIEKYNRQVAFEAQIFKAWIHAGPKELKEEAPKRLKKEGWKSARNSFATTIRAWIIQAFIQSSMGRHAPGVEFFSRAVDILEWGRRFWKDVPKDDRGAIFEVTFVRGVKKLYMSAMHQWLCQKDPNCKYTMEDLAELAQDIIVDTDIGNVQISPDPADPGFVSSFCIYPKGEAFSMLGWYHMQLALRSTVAEDKYRHYTESASYYMKAAECFPEDDEKHCIFLRIVLDAYTFRGTPVKDVLALCKRIRLAIPKMKAIWEVSSFLQGGGNKLLQQALEMEIEIQRNILEGRVDPDSSVMLEPETGSWASILHRNASCYLV